MGRWKHFIVVLSLEWSQPVVYWTTLQDRLWPRSDVRTALTPSLMQWDQEK